MRFLIFPYDNPKRQYYHHFHFSDEKLSLREVKQLAQSHTASTIRRWKLIVSDSGAPSHCFPVTRQ